MILLSALITGGSHHAQMTFILSIFVVPLPVPGRRGHAHMKLTQHRKATIFQLKNNNFKKKLKTNKKAIVTDKI